MSSLTVPRVILHEPNLISYKLSGSRGQSPFTNHGRFLGLGIHQRTPPGGTLGVLNDQVVSMLVVTINFNCATDTGSTIGTIAAIRMLGSGASLERGKGGVDDLMTLGVRTGLKTSVTDVCDVQKVELLGKVVTRLVRGLGNVEGESDIVQSLRRSRLETPIVSNETKGNGRCASSENGSDGNLHFLFVERRTVRGVRVGVEKVVENELKRLFDKEQQIGSLLYRLWPAFGDMICMYLSTENNCLDGSMGNCCLRF